MTISIDGNTFTTPTGYEISYYIPSTARTHANGRAFVQGLDSTEIHEFSLRWENNFSQPDQSAMELAFYALCGGSVVFVDPQGNSWNVMRHPDQDRFTVKAVRLYNVSSLYWLWTAELKMIEAI